MLYEDADVCCTALYNEVSHIPLKLKDSRYTKTPYVLTLSALRFLTGLRAEQQ